MTIRTLPSKGHQFHIAISLFCCVLVVAAWQMGQHPVIPIIIAFLPIAALVALNNSFLVVLGFILFSFFRLHEVFPFLGPFRLPILLALASFGALAWNIFSGKIKVFWTKELTLFSIFFTVVAIGAILASNRGAAFDSLFGTYIKIAMIVLAIAWMTQTVSDLKRASFMVFIAGSIVAITALYNAANGIGLVEGTRVTIGRDIGSMLGDPNDLALVLLFPSAFALSYIMSPNIKPHDRIMGWGIYILMFAAIFATQSRGGLLGIMAVTGVFAWYKIPSKTLLVIAGLCGALILYIVADIGDRASGGLHEGGLDESAAGRLYAWEAAFWMAVHNPLTGVGINNFLYNYWEYSNFWDGKNHAVHSTWFGVLAETGFLGFLMFITLVLSSIRNMIQLIKTLQLMPNHPYLYAMAKALLAGLVGFCVSGTFLTMGFVWPFYIMLALSIALCRIVSQIENNTSTRIQ